MSSSYAAPKQPSCTSQDDPEEEPTYTREQLEDVRRINECKNPYEILRVNRESSESDIEKSYKKISLLVHPDKNKAPGALEAFKSLGNAKETLTDWEKRMQYDMTSQEQSQELFETDLDTKDLIVVGLGVAGLAVGVAAGIWLFNQFVKPQDTESGDRKRKKESDRWW